MTKVPPDNQQVFQTTAGLMRIEESIKAKAEEEEQNNRSISKDLEGYEYEYQTKPYDASQPSHTLPVVDTLYSKRFNKCFVYNESFTQLTVAHLASEHVTLNKDSIVVKLSGNYYQDATTSLSDN